MELSFLAGCWKGVCGGRGVGGLQDQRHSSVTRECNTKMTRGVDSHKGAAAPQQYATKCATAGRGPPGPTV